MELQFDEMERTLWPSLLLVKAGREDRSWQSLIQMIRDNLAITRVRASDRDSQAYPKIPCSIEEVSEWLDAVWRRLQTAEESESFARRRTILQAIVESGVADKDKARLTTVLDYLYRLSVAGRVAKATRGTDQVEIPTTRSPAVQRSYRKMAGLSKTDLPVWLVGEKGTELEWAARTIHRLGGGAEAAFVRWDTARASFPDDTEGRSLLAADATVLIRGVEEAPQEDQRRLHDHLVGELGAPQTCRIIVTTAPFDLENEPPAGVHPDLFAFLRPTRVEIPALRSRMEDLAGLITFFARSRGLRDPLPRVSEDAMEMMRSHHWPGNTEELGMAIAYAVKRRPAGEIRTEDLPETIRPPSKEEGEIVPVLETIHNEEGFRVLAADHKRRIMARFLTDRSAGLFAAVEFQEEFHLGRETAGRLLRALMDRGLIMGVKGAKGQRITRYRRVAGGEVSAGIQK